MPKRKPVWHHGEGIPGTKCPLCGSEITYNGNYFCTGYDSEIPCGWALPHPIELIVDQRAYQDALTRLLAMRGEVPTRAQLEETG